MVGKLEELQMVQSSLGALEATADRLHLSPNVDERFRLPTPADLGMLQVGDHSDELLAQEEVHALGEVPGGVPPVLFGQGIAFRVSLGFRSRVIEEVPEGLFEQQDLLHDGPGIDLHHLGDEQPLLGGPAVHVF